MTMTMIVALLEKDKLPCIANWLLFLSYCRDDDVEDDDDDDNDDNDDDDNDISSAADTSIGQIEWEKW